MKLTIYSDGGSRGNPGICAYAIVVTKDGKVIFEDSKFLGTETNNYAEYRGLIAGISKAIELGADDVEFINTGKGEASVQGDPFMGMAPVSGDDLPF